MVETLCYLKFIFAVWIFYSCTHIIGPFGGSGGDPFNEIEDNCRATVKRIVIYHETLVDSIQVTYQFSTGQEYIGKKYGGDRGRRTVIDIDIDRGERISSVFGYARRYVDSLGFITNTGKLYGPYGGDGGDYFHTGECILHGIFGASKRLVDRIGFACERLWAMI